MRLKYLTLSLLALCSFAFAQETPEKAPEKITFESKEEINVAQFIERNKTVFDSLDISFITSKTAAQVTLPAFRFTVEQSQEKVVNALEWTLIQLSGGKLDTSVHQGIDDEEFFFGLTAKNEKVELKEVVRLYPFGDLVPRISYPTGPSPAEEELKRLEEKEAQARESTIKAIEDLMRFSFKMAEKEFPKFSVHKNTDTLVVKGLEEDHALVEQVLKSLD